MNIDDQDRDKKLGVAGTMNTMNSMEQCNYPGTLIDCADFVLSTVAVKVTELLEAALTPLDLRVRHYRLLLLLAVEGARAQSSIGPALGVDRTTVVALVDHLEQLGAAKRVRCEDRRAYFVDLTAKGKRLARQAVMRVRAVEAQIFAPLTPAEQDTLRRLSARLLAG
jgi:DNA-binding MarR family transcriptional regulator